MACPDIVFLFRVDHFTPALTSEVHQVVRVSVRTALMRGFRLLPV